MTNPFLIESIIITSALNIRNITQNYGLLETNGRFPFKTAYLESYES